MLGAATTNQQLTHYVTRPSNVPSFLYTPKTCNGHTQSCPIDLAGTNLYPNYSGGDTERSHVYGLPGLQGKFKSSMTDAPTLRTMKSITIVCDHTI